MELGQIILSVGAKVVLAKGESEELLKRHDSGDYGYISLADATVNDFALEDGGYPIFSRYRTRKGFDVEVVTDELSTTIRLHGEA